MSDIKKLLLSVVILFVIIAGCKKNEVVPSNNVTPPSNIIPTTPVVTDNAFYSISGSDSAQPKGQILFALNSKTQGELFITDERGSIITEKAVGTDVENFQKWNINGVTRYTYFRSVGYQLLDSIPGTELGYEYICDSNLNILDTVKLLSNGIINSTQQDEVDVHEFVLLGDHHYICETYYSEKPNNIPSSLNPAPGVKVAACIIQEVNNGSVVFQWDASQFPEFYASSQENNNFNSAKLTHDYLHLNSICVDSTDNNLIVSFRNLDEIIKINRQSGTIMWRLGGANSDFSQAPNQLFLRQHYARVIEGGKTLIFIDNGDSARPSSRILEYQLDQNAKTISGFKSYQVPDKFIQFAGSVQKVGDYYFIGAGAGDYVLKINYVTNQVLLRLTLFYPSYRTLQYE
jgi:arylsulfate sulfotransferase